MGLYYLRLAESDAPLRRAPTPPARRLAVHVSGGVADEPLMFRAALMVLSGPGRPALDVLTGEPSAEFLAEGDDDAVLEFDGIIPPGKTHELGGVPRVRRASRKAKGREYRQHDRNADG